MDKVFIEALQIECVIGIYDWERTIKQPIVLDIEMAFDNRIPAASDNIEHTLDYKAVSKRLIEFVSASSWKPWPSVAVKSFSTSSMCRKSTSSSARSVRCAARKRSA
jgi:FolB domain-containing protein